MDASPLAYKTILSIQFAGLSSPLFEKSVQITPQKTFVERFEGRDKVHIAA